MNNTFHPQDELFNCIPGNSFLVNNANYLANNAFIDEFSIGKYHYILLQFINASVPEPSGSGINMITFEFHLKSLPPSGIFTFNQDIPGSCFDETKHFTFTYAGYDLTINLNEENSWKGVQYSPDMRYDCKGSFIEFSNDQEEFSFKYHLKFAGEEGITNIRGRYEGRLITLE